MRKGFSFILVCMFAFLFSVSTASAIAHVSVDTCMTCHESTVSDGGEILRLAQDDINSLRVFEGNPAVQVAPVLLSGNTSQFIQPFFTKDIPGQPYPFIPADYIEEPSYPLTDYSGMRVDYATPFIPLVRGNYLQVKLE